MTTDIIPPSEIHSELARIWDSMEGTNKMRASLFNLIFYTKKKGRAEYIKTIANKVIEKFPSRVTIITEDSEGGDFLNTRVSVVSSGASNSEIACDSIELDVGGTFAERIPYVILPHLLPDLPVYVIWGDAPDQTAPLFQALKKIANRFIFDSEATDDLSQFAASLLQIQADEGVAISDLNWGRTESWRSLVTSTFYSSERLEKLKSATNFTLLYNSSETEFYHHAPFQSLYMQGWIARQLGWNFESLKKAGGTIDITYNKPDGKAIFKLVSEKREGLNTGAILSLDVKTADHDQFSFGRNPKLPHHISMHFSTLEKCDVPLHYIFSKNEVGQSLVREICQKGTSQHFVRLLESIKGRKEYTSCGN